MADATQYTYTHRELITLMLKAQGIHEGKWSLLVNFGFGALNAGPSAAEILPSAIVQINGLGVQRAVDSTGTSITVDAAEVNPKI